MRGDPTAETPPPPVVLEVREALGSYSTHPVLRLYAIRLIRQMLDEEEALRIAEAREMGHTWQDIGDALGISRQAVYDRYGVPSGRERLPRGELQRCQQCGFESRVQGFFERGLCGPCRARGAR